MSNCSCHKLLSNSKKPVDKGLRIDPTRTTILRKNFEADMVRRFSKLRKEIWQAIVNYDVFGLVESNKALLFNATEKQFDFPRSADKVTAFMKWLDEMEEKHILTVTERPTRIGQSSEEAWTNVYVQSAYQQGIRRAGQEMKKAGVKIPIPVGLPGKSNVSLSFNSPVHVDRVGLLYTRVFSGLKGITDAMDSQISSTLAQGLTEGRSPKVIARLLNDRVEKIGIVRARTLARTEIVRAHHMASIQEYKNAGLLGVKIKSEWLTAGFNVCPVCAPLEGKIFTIEQIEPMIPRHPNCRCTAIPYIEGISPKK